MKAVHRLWAIRFLRLRINLIHPVALFVVKWLLKVTTWIHLKRLHKLYSHISVFTTQTFPINSVVYLVEWSTSPLYYHPTLILFGKIYSSHECYLNDIVIGNFLGEFYASLSLFLANIAFIFEQSQIMDSLLTSYVIIVDMVSAIPLWCFPFLSTCLALLFPFFIAFTLHYLDNTTLTG